MSQGQITSSWLIESREKDRPTHKIIIRKESLVSLINDDRDAIIGRDIHPSIPRRTVLMWEIMVVSSFNKVPLASNWRKLIKAVHLLVDRSKSRRRVSGILNLPKN